MKKKKLHTGRLATLPEKAEIVRDMATKFGLTCVEEASNNPQQIRFVFRSQDEDLLNRFFSALPRDVFAKRAFTSAGAFYAWADRNKDDESLKEAIEDLKRFFDRFPA